MPPVQVVASFGVGATTTPAGSVSVKSSPMTSTGLAVLVIVNVRVLTPPFAIAAGAKDFVNTGGDRTVSVSIADPLFPADDIRSPEVLTCASTVLLVTSADTVHIELAGTVPPVKLITPVPASRTDLKLALETSRSSTSQPAPSI